MISGSGETPVTLHIARLARDFGAHVLAVTARADSTLARLADAVIEVPKTVTVQFGGTLFEQSALLLLDAWSSSSPQAIRGPTPRCGRGTPTCSSAASGRRACTRRRSCPRPAAR